MQHFGHLKEGPPQTVTYGGFPSEPTEDLGSIRVTNETPQQEVQPEVLVKPTKFTIFRDCSVCVSYVTVLSEVEWRGGCRMVDVT